MRTLDIGLRVADLERSLAFYTRLGYQKLGEVPETPRTGFRAELQTVFPAVTCSVQSSFLTGLMSSEHGIVGNG
jgi:predicted AlkP superfamily pyrophosphatase or phosphodiesterase